MTREPAKRARRPRYAGTHPRKFDERYKELDPARYPEESRKITEKGRTPAGSHRPVLLDEVLSFLSPQPGECGVDATLGGGGHAEAILERIRPAGRLLALDVDRQEIARTTARLRAKGYGEEELVVRRGNFAGLAKHLEAAGFGELDFLLADLGCSSMQLDEPARGFTFKHDGPLDLRMNPDRGAPASRLLAKISCEKLATLLRENADEPQADRIADEIVRVREERPIETTTALAHTIREALKDLPDRDREEAGDRPLARVFQALRIEVNEEYGALDAFLEAIPAVLSSGGRVVVISFHSGEDRRVKSAFREGLRKGIYSRISENVVRATPEEVRGNPRARPAKLRWGERA